MATRSEPQAAARKPRRQVPLRLVIALILVGLAIVFGVQNRDLVDIRLLVPVVTMPLWVALAGMFVIGIVGGLLLGRPLGRPRR